MSNDHDRRLVTDLLRALCVGPVVIEHRPGLHDEGVALASAYRPGDGVIELNPDASPERQAAGLMSALRRLGHSARPALHAVPAATDHPAARVVGGP